MRKRSFGRSVEQETPAPVAAGTPLRVRLLLRWQGFSRHGLFGHRLDQHQLPWLIDQRVEGER